MPITVEDFSAESRRIKLTGRLDIEGVRAIEKDFSDMATAARSLIVVDLQAVDFLGSLGIRSIIFNAKARQKRGGRLVVFVGDNNVVSQTLEMTGISSLVPVFTDWESAQKALIWSQ